MSEQLEQSTAAVAEETAMNELTTEASPDLRSTDPGAASPAGGRSR